MDETQILSVTTAVENLQATLDQVAGLVQMTCDPADTGAWLRFFDGDSNASFAILWVGHNSIVQATA